MPGRKELVAAAVAALTAALAAVGLASLDDAKVVEVRVQGGVPILPDMAHVEETTANSAPYRKAERVLWAEEGDVWLYDGEDGRRRRLTTDGVARHDFRPRFRSAGTVTYLSAAEEYGPDPAMFEYDLATGESEMVRLLPGFVRRLTSPR